LKIFNNGKIKICKVFLTAMHNWVVDMEGFYANTQQPQPEHIPWKIFADILMAGKIYE